MGIVYIDKNGKCVSPLYTWQDVNEGIFLFIAKMEILVVKKKIALIF